MKARDRAPAALSDHPGAVVLVERDHDCRLAEAIDDARSDDPDHARMPALRTEHDRAAIVAVQLLLLNLCQSGVENLFLHRLPLAILLLQIGRDLNGALAVGQCQHLYCLARMTQPAAGVKARGEQKTDVIAVERLTGQSCR